MDKDEIPNFLEFSGIWIWNGPMDVANIVKTARIVKTDSWDTNADGVGIIHWISTKAVDPPQDPKMIRHYFAISRAYYHGPDDTLGRTFYAIRVDTLEGSPRPIIVAVEGQLVTVTGGQCIEAPPSSVIESGGSYGHIIHATRNEEHPGVLMLRDPDFGFSLDVESK